MRQESAQILAIRALGWMAAQEGLIEGFLSVSGASVEDLRAQAQDSDFLAGVLDYLLMEDRWVLDCSSDLGEAPEAFMQARAVLGRGDLRHWT
ncbi:DUF3572 domain-containing protein [Thioclava pacifica]|uniref:DUF3572 domain-containing protein n=1 Tax=Thioclava pacifica DSM 10166 TaxID=1353537 RepID=A0A074JBB6_9RHOB|nr:DUF3572 domain-containing protein [Thioclava pacifica]KEO52878.1 hypothetical protein TP2_08025 [Thioclava pacifica DSM 10166]